MAYHGSSVGAVRRVLDRGELGAGTVVLPEAGAFGPQEGGSEPALLTGTASILSCRPLKEEPGVGFEEPGENCAPPRAEQPPSVLLSPSLQYAGAETLASKVQ